MMVSAGWAVLLLFAGLFAQAKSQGSCTAAHPIDMSEVDSFPLSSGRALVIAYQTIPCDGEIVTWSASVRGMFQLSFLVWERNTSSVYNLVGQNNFKVNSDEDSITEMNFEPLQSDRITVKAGQVVGLHSIVDGTLAGVKAVMVPQTSQNITYDFETMSLDDVSSIDTTSSSIRAVPNVRPLISAIIQVPGSTAPTPPQVTTSSFHLFSTSSSLPSIISTIASSSHSGPSSSLFSTASSQLNVLETSTFTQLQNAISSTQTTKLSSSKSPTETEAASDVNLPAMLSVIGIMLVVILVFLTASCFLGAYLIVRNGRRKNLRSDVPIRVLPGLDNGIYMSQIQRDNEYAMVTHQKILTTTGDSSPSLSHSGSSHSKHQITPSAVYHHYEACAASEYLKPVPLSKSLSNDVPPMPSSVSVVYEVPVVVVNRNELEKSSQPWQQSARYETPIDGKYEEVLDTNKDNNRHDNVASPIYDTPPDAAGNLTL